MEPEIAIDWNSEGETNYKTNEARMKDILKYRDGFSPADEDI